MKFNIARRQHNIIIVPAFIIKIINDKNLLNDIVSTTDTNFILYELGSKLHIPNH